MSLTREQRQTLESLSDVLIPASDTMPSASQAEIGFWCDQLLQRQPDVEASLVKVLDEVRTETPEAAVARLKAKHRRQFAVLAEIVAGAYFMNPEIQQQIGYDGPSARPIPTNTIDANLLQPVVDRGPVFRRPPAS